MIPRTQNPMIAQNPKPPFSPKFGNSYGLQSERQVLIDQIINNCQRAESPLHTGRNSCQSSKNSSIRNQINDREKENSRHFQSPNPIERLSIGKRQSYEHQKFNTSRPSTQYMKQKRSSTSNNSNYYPPLNLEQQRSQQEYYPKILRQNMSPTYKLKTNLQIPKSKRHNSTDKRPNPLQQNHLNLGRMEELKNRLEEERVKHLEHCKKEARKLRLYYVQLQNKLCQIRNKQLNMLAEYEQTRLKQYDDYLRNLNSSQKEINLEEYTAKLEQINKGPTAKVNQSIKPEIQGCLFTGISGIYFSFDQKNL